ncbi:MAG TPA: hypothetical protein VJ835_01505 [Fimbriimonadaceae bacterium]|nr:hypothetical protein [Fimbriimonadaceae bacterium]
MTSDPVERFFMERAARLNRRARLRVMTSSEVIDQAIRVYQQLGLTFLKTSILPTLLIVAAFAFVGDYIFPSLFTTQNASSLETQFSEVAFATILAGLVGGTLVIIGVSVTSAIVTHLVSDFMLGNVPSSEGAIRAATRTVGTLIRVHFWEFLLGCGGLVASLGLSILSSALDQSTSQDNVVAGLIAVLAIGGFCVSGIIFLLVASRHALAAPIAVLEGKGPRESAKRSAFLLKSSGRIPSGYGHVWSLFTVLFLVSMLVAGGLSGFLEVVGVQAYLSRELQNVPYGGLLDKAVGLIPMFLWIWAMVPVWSTSITIIYYDRRIRLEGYDIEALAADVWRTDRQTRFEL